MIRWITTLAVAVLGGSVVLAGCATEVPVKVELAARPAECDAPVKRLPPMSPLPKDAAERLKACNGQPLAVCVSARWAARDLSWQGVVRRAESRRQVCQAWGRKIQKS